jgi:hypothetical protein
MHYRVPPPPPRYTQTYVLVLYYHTIKFMCNWNVAGRIRNLKTMTESGFMALFPIPMGRGLNKPDFNTTEAML